MQDQIDHVSIQEAIDYYGTLAQLHQRRRRVPGVQVAVAVGDRVAYTGAFGHADVENGIALTDAHLFRIASQSKMLTAIVVMQLVEQRILRLDDTLAQHLPELAGTSLARVAVRELMSHAAGVFRDGSDPDFWQLRLPFPDRARLIEEAKAPGAAVLPAGERFRYSNFGYGLLGLVVESATGRTYAEQVQRGVFDRLGLADVGADLPSERLAELAVAYSSLTHFDRRVPIDHVATRALAPATGGYGTARDLVRIVAALAPGDERLLSDGSKRQMRNPSWEAATANSRYGLGLALVKIGGRELLGHDGGFPGHSSVSLVEPSRRWAVSVMTNAIDGAAWDLAMALPQLVELAGSRPRPRPEPDLHRFAGRFANLGTIWDVAVLGGRLYRLFPLAADPAATAVALEYVDDRTVRVAGGSGLVESLRYRFTAAGAVESIHDGFGGSGTMVPLTDFVLPDRVRVRRPTVG